MGGELEGTRPIDVCATMYSVLRTPLCVLCVCVCVCSVPGTNPDNSLGPRASAHESVSVARLRRGQISAHPKKEKIG